MRAVLWLPQAALAQCGPAPCGGGSRFEPKTNGLRYLTTHTASASHAAAAAGTMPLLPELAGRLPRTVQFDGEFVALGVDGLAADNGQPDVPRPNALGKGNNAFEF